MSAVDVIGVVSDRLVGGMMFHQDHADMLLFAGARRLAKRHREEYLHDSRCLSRVRKACIAHCGMVAPSGRQERTHTLDALRGKVAWEQGHDECERMAMESIRDWIEWEDGTVAVLTDARARLVSCDELRLARMVEDLVCDASDELADARAIWNEMQATGWDMSHLMEA